MDDILKKSNKIEKIFSYGQEKINDLNTFKESNIGILQNLINSLFKYIYNYKKEDIKNNIDNILSTLDEFLQVDFNPVQKEIEDLKSKMELIKKKLNEILYENMENIKNLFAGYKKYIAIFLNEKKENMKTILKDENKENILLIIDKEVDIKLNGIKVEIEKILNDIENKIVNLFEEGNSQINEFSEGKIPLKLPNKLGDYLLSQIGDKKNSYNLMEQLFLEIKCVKKLSKIYDIKGFRKFIKSAFSEYQYIINNIDIISQSFIEKMVYISFLINDNLFNYIEGLLHTINKACDIISIRYANKQLDNWKEIVEYYYSIKNQIVQAKNDILKK